MEFFNRDDGRRKRKTRRVGQVGIKRSQLTNTCLQLWDRPPRLPEIYIARFREDESRGELGGKKKRKEKKKQISRLIFFIEILTELKWAFLKPRDKPCPDCEQF